jgi:hypothetical protein
LWALTWFTTAAIETAPAVQGGFAVGSVMASSGLALLWSRTMQAIHDADQEEDDADAEPQVVDDIAPAE